MTRGVAPASDGSLQIGPLTDADRAVWESLFRGYIDFYERTLPDERYDQAWRELRSGARMHALGARSDGELIGIAHFFIHANTSGPDVCYLQDLFTAPESRGQGAATALIEAVAAWARERGCMRLYWSTHESNATARRVYDRVATNRGFIRYEIDL
ncbi:MAG TPA: GNAT family N-acetyltransferase [Solirubrobacteraceae bacterium]